ncbi:putative alpha-1,2-mannosidase [Catenulispora sp. MAP12-49]|uniref:GH92 family glycosyl hydrolase n=1 Tax=Catenulispora sp. MAP12-49 TaxID=3156302 RepID=UPI003517B827
MTSPNRTGRPPRRRSSLISAGALIAAAALGTAGLSAGAAQASTKAAVKAAFVADPASTVNTLVMTSGGGNDFPGADSPFGMVQWGPDSPNGSRNDGGGYDYGATSTRGFSLTHMAGPGCGAMGDVPVLPFTGGLPSGDPGVLTESLNHSTETGNAGYYTVSTGSTPVKTELTTTAHTGMARFTFPATTQADLLLKLLDSENGSSNTAAQIVGSNEVTGQVTSGGFCGETGSYTLHFDMVFDQSFTSSQVISESGQGSPNSVFLNFNTSSNQVVQAKVGLSYVSAANASANLAAEQSGFNFSTVQTAAHNAWNAQLGKIQIAGGTAAQQQLFYTSLYHALLHPNTVTDVNGQYMGFDNAVHTAASGHAQYDQFSGWDVYKGQTQLDAFVDPSIASDQAQSLVNDYAQGGTFPQWGFMNFYNWVMDGDPATAAISNYYAFGGTGFDTSTALSDMLTEATTNNNVRRGTSLENTYGYLPSDLYTGSLGCCNVRDSASSLIEYDNADFALSRFASAMGDSANATKFNVRANNWKHIFNPANQLLNPVESNGNFDSITTGTTTGFTESTAAQNRFDVGFDQTGLAALYGGNSTINSALDYYFQTFNSAHSDQSFLSNEVDLGTPWFYDWTGEPSHTQSVVNRFLNQLYQDTPGGFPNNDDLGTMSSQYVWGALGIYPVTPGSADLAYNSPLFTQAVVHLDSGKTITINAPAASSSNYYVQSLNVNGTASTHTWLPASTWKAGVTLDFTLGSSASSWGTGAGDAPPSYDQSSSGSSTGPITSGIAGKCADDSSRGTANGTHIQLWTCNGSVAQQFTVNSNGSLGVMGGCVDVTSGGTTDGTLVQLYTCNGTGSQVWQQQSNGSLVNPQSGKCLDDPNSTTTDGTQLQIYTCNGTNAQKWTLP